MVVGLLHYKFSVTEINDGIWRLPYFLGILLVAVGIYMRKFLGESPEFQKIIYSNKIKKIPFLVALQQSHRKMLQVVGLNVFIAVSFYILFVWMPIYLHFFQKFTLNEAFFLNISTMVVLVILTPCCGYIADKIGRNKMAVMCAILVASLVYPAFQIINTGRFLETLIALTVLAICFSLIEGTTAAITSQLFDAEYRLSGIGPSYNISMSLFGGTAPLICTFLITKTNWFLAPALYIVISALVGITTIISIIYNKHYISAPERLNEY